MGILNKTAVSLQNHKQSVALNNEEYITKKYWKLEIAKRIQPQNLQTENVLYHTSKFSGQC